MYQTTRNVASVCDGNKKRSQSGREVVYRGRTTARRTDYSVGVGLPVADGIDTDAVDFLGYRVGIGVFQPLDILDTGCL